MPKNEGLTLQLEDFVGPMDLLLHLIKSMEVDIYDIPMKEVTHQYLMYIHTADDLSLEQAGEYLVLAATLIEIKSKMLLPVEDEKLQDLEELPDPRQELVDQLLLYQAYKVVAETLQDKQVERRQYFGKRPTDMSFLQQQTKLPPGQVTTDQLMRAFQQAVWRLKQQEPIQAKISYETITIEEAMDTIRNRLAKVGPQGIDFRACLNLSNREHIVTSFLAVLQLIRQQEIIARQEHLFDPIILGLK